MSLTTSIHFRYLSFKSTLCHLFKQRLPGRPSGINELVNFFYGTSLHSLQESQPETQKVDVHLLSFAYWKDLGLSAYWTGHVCYYLASWGLCSAGTCSQLSVMLAGVPGSPCFHFGYTWFTWLLLHHLPNLLAPTDPTYRYPPKSSAVGVSLFQGIEIITECLVLQWCYLSFSPKTILNK